MLVKVIEERAMESMTVPPLGRGNSGLNRRGVKEMTEESLEHSECDVYMFEPDASLKAALRRGAY